MPITTDDLNFFLCENQNDQCHQRSNFLPLFLSGQYYRFLLSLTPDIRDGGTEEAVGKKHQAFSNQQRVSNLNNSKFSKRELIQ
jgi:hypothetical protein